MKRTEIIDALIILKINIEEIEENAFIKSAYEIQLKDMKNALKIIEEVYRRPF